MPQKKKGLPTVSEVRLKRRKIMDQRNLTSQNIKLRPRKQLEIFHHAEDFVKQHRAVERSVVHRRKVKKNFVSLKRKNDKSVNVFFVMLYQRRAIAIAKHQKAILKALRLSRQGDSTFVKNTPQNRVMLKKIEPYVTYGIPKMKMVRSLIEKHGMTLEEDVRVPLNDNSKIEKHFIEVGIDDGSIVCLDDLVHEVASGGPNFDKVMEYLEPFKLTNPSGFTKSLTLFKDGGFRGDRGKKINEFLQQCIG
ncbi:putative 60S ribosomal protein L7 [Monocercomonoides exilis]|uniref:putative 60S ribosomal protein L7 n=1 Tax=Monocercomonoides exilis TaxID=2049356 RepID=UPI003559E7DD|nr:putative 60S ribosomal protein L7 [Monocercomonoides exilis]